MHNFTNLFLVAVVIILGKYSYLCGGMLCLFAQRSSPLQRRLNLCLAAKNRGPYYVLVRVAPFFNACAADAYTKRMHA